MVLVVRKIYKFRIQLYFMWILTDRTAVWLAWSAILDIMNTYGQAFYNVVVCLILLTQLTRLVFLKSSEAIQKRALLMEARISAPLEFPRYRIDEIQKHIWKSYEIIWTFWPGGESCDVTLHALRRTFSYWKTPTIESSRFRSVGRGCMRFRQARVFLFRI